MNSDTNDLAERLKVALRAQIKALDEQRARKQELLVLLERETTPIALMKERLVDEARQGPNATMAERAYAALAQLGRPSRVLEIAKAIARDGGTTSARVGLAPMVNSVLRRRKDLFVKVARGRYGLVGQVTEPPGPTKEVPMSERKA